MSDGLSGPHASVLKCEVGDPLRGHAQLRVSSDWSRWGLVVQELKRTFRIAPCQEVGADAVVLKAVSCRIRKGSVRSVHKAAASGLEHEFPTLAIE
jgi:hypothetical protein